MSNTPTCPSYLRPLLTLFSSHGQRAYPVGGCVRDTLLGTAPHDWDLAVTTIPEDTMSICETAGYRTIPTGLKHGTVTVLVPHSGDPADREGSYDLIECTTCRTEGGYSDGRHPDAVSFTGRIRDDLARRDFTVNAMAFTDEGAHGEALSVLDLFGGQEDLQNRVIRAVGDPDTRFSEDALRLMRAVRFAMKLGFSIEEDTRAAIVRRAHGLARISRERISDEFQKILIGPRPEEGVSMLMNLGLMPYVLPRGISAEGMGNLSALPPDLSARTACLLWGMAEGDLTANLAGLRLSNSLRKNILTLAGSITLPADPSPYSARLWRHSLGTLAIPAVALRGARPAANMVVLRDLAELIRASETRREAVNVSDLAIGGSDLIALGCKPGKGIRDLLDALLYAVWANPELNTKEALLDEAKRRMEEGL